MQRWEYQTLLRTRGFGQDPRNPKAEWMAGNDWSHNVNEVLAKLGDEGWELVSVTPRSRYLGGYHGGNVGWSTHDYAGFTNEEVWVFKRPKA